MMSDKLLPGKLYTSSTSTAGWFFADDTQTREIWNSSEFVDLSADLFFIVAPDDPVMYIEPFCFPSKEVMFDGSISAHRVELLKFLYKDKIIYIPGGEVFDRMLKVGKFMRQEVIL